MHWVPAIPTCLYPDNYNRRSLFAHIVGNIPKNEASLLIWERKSLTMFSPKLQTNFEYRSLGTCRSIKLFWKRSNATNLGYLLPILLPVKFRFVEFQFAASRIGLNSKTLLQWMLQQSYFPITTNYQEVTIFIASIWYKKEWVFPIYDL